MKVLCALGNTARNAIKPDARRGYVYPIKLEGDSPQEEPLPFIQTFHPSYILRGAQKEEPTWSRDLSRVLDLAQNGVRFTEPDLCMFPTIHDVERITGELLRRKPKPRLAVDIETIGLRPFEVKIIVIGIAWDAEHALSIPLLKQGGAKYWLASEEARARRCLIRLFAECPTLFQYAPFDIQHLENDGIPVLRPGLLPDDVLLEHHAINPELPHNLEYLASAYSNMPSWKSEMGEDPRRLIMQPDEKTREYNLRDALVLHPIHAALQPELDEGGTRHIYERFSKRLIPVVVELTRNGMIVSQGRLATWQAHVRKELRSAERKLRREFALPPTFNLDSDHHLRWYLYGAMPSSLARKREELASYDLPPELGKNGKPKRGKSKDTKKYVELAETCAIYALPHLERTRATMRKTDTGAFATDEQALLAHSISAAGEIAQIEERRETPFNRTRKASLRRVITFIEGLSTYNEFSKLNSTYMEFPTGPDGRVHAWYSIHRTATGRLASSSPNMQQVPKPARVIFVPEAGWVFLEADYSNLELRVLAYETDDEVLQAMFDKGLNVHSENCRLLFGIEEDHPNWEDARKACKTYIFGRIYGGTVRGIFEKVAMQVPKLGLTFSRFSEIDERYFDAHPKYALWYTRTVREVRETRTVRTANGRVRYLLGDEGSAIREGLNLPIQGTGSEVVMDATIRFKEWRDEQKSRTKLVASTHDSLTSEVPKAELGPVAAALLRILQEPQDLWGRKVSFPVELKMSASSWGEMEPCNAPKLTPPKAESRTRARSSSRT
jgi:DNA polymerase I-like protein with 3'-5' exonuclease and polymerase domains